MNWFKKSYPLLGGIIIYWITISVMLFLSLKSNDGNLVYDLDDPYIHMAIAKNFVEYGSWGINSSGFSSSTSSPLWTMLLSGVYAVFGVKDVIPLILNIFFGTALIYLTWFILQKNNVKSYYILFFLAFFVYLMPLTFVTFTGMEHNMHAFLALWFVYLAVENISNGTQKFGYAGILLLSVLVTGARYESLFLVFTVCLFYFFYKKRYAFTIALGLTSLLPVIAYGIWSVTKGWYFLPNSVYLKGSTPKLLSIKGILKTLGFNAVEEFLQDPVLLALPIAALMIMFYLFIKNKYSWDKFTVFLSIFIINSVFHMQYAKNLPRYTSYLVTFGTIAIFLGCLLLIKDWKEWQAERRKWLPLQVTQFLILFFFALPLIWRSAEHAYVTTLASNNIYQQQFQMSRFLERFYNDEKVAANDIGLINYKADIDCYDLWGLGNMEVAELRKARNYTTEMIDQLTKKNNVKIAILYDSWFDGSAELPSNWIKAGDWMIGTNYVCGDSKVSFYAVDPDKKEELIRNLQNFSDKLPSGVYEMGLYRELMNENETND